MAISALSFASCKKQKCETCSVTRTATSNGSVDYQKSYSNEYCDEDLEEIKKTGGSIDYGNGTNIITTVDCK